MRRVLFFAALLLTACSPSEPPPPLPAAAATTAWFICDGIDAPAVFVFERDGGAIRMAEHDKPNGAIVAREDYTLGAGEGAAGSVYVALMRGEEEAGAVRQINPAMLETPGAAYTPRITEVRLGERVISCRWLARTRVFAITGRRSVVVHEDADGDLIYTTFDFAAPAADPIELSDGGLSTQFSTEVRGGEEHISADDAEFRFTGPDGYSYILATNRDGAGRLAVLRDGSEIQAEELVALQVGQAQ